MDNFFNSIKDNLENRPEPPFREEAWDNMKKKLESTRENKRTASGLFWWIPLLSFLLAGSVILNYSFYQQLKNSPLSQEQKITNTFQIDTIIKTNVIYLTDTIFQTRTKNKIVYISKPTKVGFTKNQFAFGNTFQKADINFSPSLKKNQSPGLNYTPDVYSNLVFWSQLNNTQSLKTSNNNVLVDRKEESIPINSTDALDLSSLPHSLLNASIGAFATNELDPVPPVMAGKFRRQLYKLRPKKVMLGLNIGNWYLTQKNISDKKGFSYGFEADIVFSENLRLFLEGSQYKIQFETNQMDESLGLPVLEAPGDNFTFEEGNLKQKGIQYAVGLKYFFNVKHTFQPYLGVGWSALSVLSHNLRYEWVDPTTNVEIEKENVPFIHGGIRSNQLVLKTGFEYKLHPSWNFQMNGQYQLRLNQNSFGIPNVFVLRTGLIYQF